MPFFKIWSGFGSDCMKKSVVVNSYAELLQKSISKLALGSPSSIKICLEDGTEVDDDETLQCLDKGTVLIVTTDFAGKCKKDSTVQDGESANTNSQAISEKTRDDGDLDFEEEEKVKDKDSSKQNFHCTVTSEATEYCADLESGSTRFTKKLLVCSDAHIKGLKTYSEAEISQAASEMERKYRTFWNEKANQLCQEAATKNKSKSALHGIIDVSWTLRKTSLLESMVHATTNDARTLKEDSTQHAQKGKQKQNTLLKNLDRMKVAHAEVVSLDEELKDRKSDHDQATTKTLLDGAYTNLKRAQEALSKSIKCRRRELEKKLSEVQNTNDDCEPPPKKEKSKN